MSKDDKCQLCGESMNGLPFNYHEVCQKPPLPRSPPNRFDYVKYDEQSTDSQGEAKTRCMLVESFINTLPEGRYKSLALTDLEKVYMWIGKSLRDEQIARDKETQPQEARCES